MRCTAEACGWIGKKENTVYVHVRQKHGSHTKFIEPGAASDQQPEKDCKRMRETRVSVRTFVVLART